jgi:uncharacterized coiled-coil protein SlyX
MDYARLSEIEAEVSQQISSLDRVLAEFESHRCQIAQLQAQMWSAHSGPLPATPAYGAAGPSYTLNTAIGSGNPHPAQGLEAMLLGFQQAEADLAAQVGRATKLLSDQSTEAQRVRDKLAQSLRQLASQGGQLGGAEAKADYHHGESAYRQDLRKCDQLLDNISRTLHRARSALSGGPPRRQVEGSLPVAMRSMTDYVRDGVRDGTLYALFQRVRAETDEPPARPTPRLTATGAQGSGSLTDKIAAGQGYMARRVSDEYQIPLPQYYYRLYRDGNSSPHSGGRFSTRG